MIQVTLRIGRVFLTPGLPEDRPCSKLSKQTKLNSFGPEGHDFGCFGVETECPDRCAKSVPVTIGHISSKCAILTSMFFAIDFDGTISLRDSVDALLDRHAPAAWHGVEAEWVDGRITAQECMRRQVGMLSATEEQMQRFFESIRLDASFEGFLAYVKTFSQVAIISDGIGRAIHTALEQAGLPGVPVYANRLTFNAQHSAREAWSLDFPNAAPGCLVGSGTCKCAVAQRLAQAEGGPIILIGDGRSDACLAGRADHVFAKDSLARHCDAEGIPYTEFETFADVLRVVQGWPMAQGRPQFLNA